MIRKKIHIILLLFIGCLLFVFIYKMLQRSMTDTVDIVMSVKAIRNTENQIQYSGLEEKETKIESNTIIASQFYKNYTYTIEHPRDIKEIFFNLGDSANTVFIEQIVFIHHYLSTDDTLLHWRPVTHSATSLFMPVSHVSMPVQNARYASFTTTGLFPVMMLKYETIAAGIKKEGKMIRQFKLIFAAGVCVVFLLLTFYMAPSFKTRLSAHVGYSRTQWLVYLFFGILIFSFINSTFNLIKDKENSENRTLSVVPNFSVKQIYKLPEQYNTYVEEHYSFRNALFFANSLLHAKLLQASALPEKVMMGKKGWFFYNEPNTIEDIRRLSRIEQSEAEIVLNILISRLQWLKKRNIKYFILVPPNKERIYPYFLPDKYYPVNGYGHNRLDYYKKLIMQYTDACFIDPTEALQLARNRKDVYYSTDTHWNLFGGFIAYQTLMDTMQKYFPQLKKAEEHDFTINDYFVSEGDLSSMIALQNIYRRKEYSFTFKDSTHTLHIAKPGDIISIFDNTTIDSSKLKLVMFRDSYANYLIPFLNLHFKRAVYIWNYEFMPEIIEREQPDIVIFESLQRFITYAFTIPNPPEVDREVAKP